MIHFQKIKFYPENVAQNLLSSKKSYVKATGNTRIDNKVIKGQLTQINMVELHIYSSENTDVLIQKLIRAKYNPENEAQHLRYGLIYGTAYPRFQEYNAYVQNCIKLIDEFDIERKQTLKRLEE